MTASILTLNSGKQLSVTQTQAVTLINDWYSNRRHNYYSSQEFFLAGYAGTGKSTIIEAIIDMMHLTSENTMLISTTGKATLVLNQKLMTFKTDIVAVTVHSLLYYPTISKKRIDMIEDEDGFPVTDDPLAVKPKTKVKTKYEKSLNFSMKERHKQLDNITLIIVDEASMLNDKMYRDLLSFGIQVLFIGDTSQLPPVKSKPVLSNPQYMLTEVRRQGAGSMVVALAEYVRDTGLLWPPGVYGDNQEVQIMTQAQFNANPEFRKNAIMHADQVICGTNRTRIALNKEARRYHGRSGDLPVVGDKLICLKNNKNIQINGIFAVNGQIGTAIDVDYDTHYVKKEPVFNIDFVADGESKINSDWLDVHELPFTSKTKVDPYDLGGEPGYFDYGYAITCHKAQGSEWDNILVFAETWDRATRVEWLNTAITRASKKIILVV